ncbi:amidase family protein [Helcococcus ovis]|uniref:Glutamyl-tRNA(Gln) amidotransferase subunit A n=2 Tax=Bacteria TaxID=2 RepID=A0A4R9C056_9FIRM|nr:amidase family protein [Helcococcus ovis]TFF63969.1 Asp-tRNA(Asn)/Glu-tRNA(Gln) amidotransferase subunit GatA [Helcococcus ovis]TFF64551.1 Asp-tRNA(Asn)/Glu-tRNA(Gln) amidotransferase subunit GatA [Helcococcus ovis]TFF65834.1 Asp-tRNA(Asn)/Glu-tRNA(Gln) amidotransferase subunit GatA [Helcococcus ovis]WNZ00737.1 amidase family protein [Helcococcus ovis]
MDIKTLHKKYRDGEFTVELYISSLYDLIEKNNYNTYLTLNKEKALEKAKKLDEKIKNKAEISGLFGVPVAVKDNILTKDLRTTASSKSLKDFVPFFDAVIMERLKSTDAIIIGKTNMDEYAMGGSSETSYFGATINPFDNTVTPGGSSSGSGAALAAEEAVVAFGSDTGGSVRNPADFCHVMGFAPTYGAIPRYGVISMSNSLDRVGVMGTTVSDIRELFNIARGKSELDFTSLDIEEFNGKVELKDLKIAVIELKDEYNVNPQIKELFDETIEKLKSLGANIDIVSLNYLDLINDVYTVIMAIEVESNIAKIDGLRYGQSVEKYDSTEDFYVKNRTDNFGEEVRRRIALGNFFASKDNDQKYYKQAMKIRGAVRSQIDKLFENYDALITPTTIDLPKKVGESSADSYASFDVGMFNMLTNLSDIPSISIPMKEGVLGSIQIAGKRYDDMRLLAIAEEVEGGLK